MKHFLQDLEKAILLYAISNNVNQHYTAEEIHYLFNEIFDDKKEI